MVPAWVYPESPVTTVVLEAAQNQVVVTANTEGAHWSLAEEWEVAGWRKVSVHRAKRAGTPIHCLEFFPQCLVLRPGCSCPLVGV